jgi:hypothetical protein
MTILQTIREWVEIQIGDDSPLADVPVYVMGESEECELPFIVLTESGSEPWEQEGLTASDVYVYEVRVELQTVPDIEGGLSNQEAQSMARTLAGILNDPHLTGYANGGNFWIFLDVSVSAVRTEAQDGRRINVIAMRIVCQSTI